MNTKSLLYLWKERTLFIGRLDEPLYLSQGAATLCVCLEGNLSIKLENSDLSFERRSVLLPPGCSVYIDCKNQLVANLNLDVMGEDFFHLSRRMNASHDDVLFDLENQQLFEAELLKLYHSASHSEQAKHLIYPLLASKDNESYPYEDRVKKVVELIQSDIGNNLSIDYLAKMVNLSVPGLTKLFKKQTGVPIRRYRQWHRLFVTASEIAQGKSLTDAALEAGFVDLSHCTHTFNMMLGMKPSYFLQRPQDISVITETSNALSCA